MNYHFTKSEYLQSIQENGLNPKVGENSEKVNDKRINQDHKLCFSQGYEGEILMSAYFFMRYEYDKSTDVKNFDEFMEPYDTLLAFDENLVQNENDNIADSHTTKSINSDKIQIVRLLNEETGEPIYDREEIVKYMMSQVPIEQLINLDKSKTGNDLKETRYFSYLEDEDKELSQKKTIEFIAEFYQKYEKDIGKYKNGNYSIDYQALTKYLELNHNELKTLSQNNLKKMATTFAKSKEVALEFQNAEDIIEEAEKTNTKQMDEQEKNDDNLLF